MTPHPVATWVQLTVSQQRQVRRRRRRRAAHLLLDPSRRLPEQRRPAEDAVDPEDTRGTIWRRR